MKPVLELYCEFMGYQGGTIHQAKQEFNKMTIEDQNKFREFLLLHEFEILDHPANFEYFFKMIEVKTLYLLRGVPGSGKTTLMNTLMSNIGLDKCSAHAADDYFTVNGEYAFNPKMLPEAHEECRSKTETDMHKHVANIFVHNTFTKKWEMDKYFELAKKYNYKVVSLIVENRHKGINEHGVPEEKVQQMRDRFEVKL